MAAKCAQKQCKSCKRKQRLNDECDDDLRQQQPRMDKIYNASWVITRFVALPDSPISLLDQELDRDGPMVISLDHRSDKKKKWSFLQSTTVRCMTQFWTWEPWVTSFQDSS